MAQCKFGHIKNVFQEPLLATFKLNHDKTSVNLKNIAFDFRHLDI